ncbi:MAG: outer membrane lipoprotein carrier protein [Halieaceae bacterium]|jgi:outer membrane lipoprotein carrier protein
MKRILLMIGLGLSLVVGVLKSAELNAYDELWAKLATFDQLQGRFEQTQFDQDGKVIAESSGNFRLLRPGFFAWEIFSPDSQLIIANPEFLWHHDRDLETVTRRPITGSAEFSPLQVLGGDAQVLRKRFAITYIEPDQFLLTPTLESTGFQQLSLRFKGDVLSSMEIIDSLNQRVRIAFSNLNADSSLTASDFSFSPPEGADLFYYDQ